MQPTWSSPYAPTILLKFPDDDRIYNFDFSRSPEIAAGLTPVSAALIVAPFPSSLGAVIETIDPSGIVAVRVAAGAAAVTYSLECNLALSDGSVLSMFGLLAVVDPNTFFVTPPPAVVPGLVSGGVFNPMVADLDAGNHQITGLTAIVIGNTFLVMGNAPPADGSYPDGSFYFNSSGGALTTIYWATGGVWVGLV